MKIPESEISQCAEYKIKSNIETMFASKKLHLRFMTLILTFMSITKKEQDLIKTYITTYSSELVFMFITELVNKTFAASYENGHTNRGPIFKKNETNSTRKKPWLQIWY